jgi:hypothetical protein
MRNPLPLSARSTPAVLSLSVLARPEMAPRQPGHYEVLVRHLFDRFFSNELMASEEEGQRTIQLCCVFALPGLIFALFKFPSYHAFPVRRTFWPQVEDHYFYVVYALVAMGIVTVYQWDLLFPDMLDVFVLTNLPIPGRKLFLARIQSMALFFGLVLATCNSLGAIFLPAVADQGIALRHFTAHFVAVFLSGLFASTFFLASQGLLLCVFGPQTLRRILPILQAAAIAGLLTVLFLFPLISGSIQPILASGSRMLLYLPPLWFLGIYQSIMGAGTDLLIFRQLANAGYAATLLTFLLALAIYPIAYKRRVRQLIEGSGVVNRKRPAPFAFKELLNTTVLLSPAVRATYYFISQSLLRLRRHRVILAMHGGLGISIAGAQLVVLRFVSHHIGVGISAAGARFAVPVLAYWAVQGVRTAITAPIDLRGSWIFQVISGKPSLQHLNGAKVFTSMFALALTLSAIVLLRVSAPAVFSSPRAMLTQILVAAGCSLLFTDVLFLKVTAMPFTALRRSSFSDLPIAAVRYLLLFPLLMLAIVKCEAWMEVRLGHLFIAAVIILMAFVGLRWVYRRRVEEMSMGSDYGEVHTIFQQIGLND